MARRDASCSAVSCALGISSISGLVWLKSMFNLARSCCLYKELEARMRLYMRAWFQCFFGIIKEATDFPTKLALFCIISLTVSYFGPMIARLC